MKKLQSLLLCFCLVALLVGTVSARQTAKLPKQPFRIISSDAPLESTDMDRRALNESAVVDTYCIVGYNFEPHSWQGWTRVDRTAQVDTFFHVDDFSGLGGGSFGSLVPLQGTKSMWCGARPNSSDPYICSWRRAPGYGNDWEQILVTDAISFEGILTFSYRVAWDSEPGYDVTHVEYDAGGGNWREIVSYTGNGSSAESHSLVLTQAQTKLRFRFASDFAWSDKDGSWDTDGACIVDEIRVRDLAGLDVYQDFESVPVNALNAGIWHARVPKPYGMYSGLRSGLVDMDPCGENFGTQVVFFLGSPNPSSSYPGLYDTPYCTGAGGLTAPCQNEIVISPVIDMKKYSTARNNIQNGTIPPADLPFLGGCCVGLSVYTDLEASNLVFYKVLVRSVGESGCTGDWQGDFTWYYYNIPTYRSRMVDVGAYIGGSDRVQIAVGVEDMCGEWYTSPGECAQHTPSPWIDDVRLYRIRTAGPHIDYWPFHDNFPSDALNMESTVRCDANVDLNDTGNPAVRLLDFIVVNANSPLGGGIATDPTLGGPAVYLHARCTYIGPAPAKPNLCGPALAGSTTTLADPPVVIDFNYVSDDGVWTMIQCDSLAEDAYIVDLNDELFTRGYRIDYYFTARDNAGIESAVPKYARSGPPYLTMTCLPTLNSNVLYVNSDWSEEYWQPVFDAVLPPPSNKVDVYHIYTHGPTGPGSLSVRVTPQQLASAYETIVWAGGFSDGTSFIGIKENDCQLIIDWMSGSYHQCGLWISCDAAAYYLDISTSPSALTLMGTWCGVDLVENSYFQLTGGLAGGGTVSPLLTGDGDAGIFMHGGVPDVVSLYGGCPVMNEFDVLEKTGTGKHALGYPSHMGTNYYGAISNETVNSRGHTVRTMWFGFDYSNLRDDEIGAPIDRFHIADDVFKWFQSITNVDVTGTETPPAYRLAQNFPNPFNPSTTIRFDMREKDLVTIKIYSVAGQLVRTLIDGVKEAGSYGVLWDGRSDRGGAVASGIYFYKMETTDFSATRKLVMLR